MWRDAYRRATDPEAFFDDKSIRTLIASNVPVVPILSSSTRARVALTNDIVAWHATRRDTWCKLAESTQGTVSATAFTTAIMKQSAPLASILGVWLQGTSAPGVFEDDAYLQMMALYADDVGVGRPEASRYDYFKSLLRDARLADFALEPFELSTLASIEDKAFRLPSILLAMSRRADVFGPELITIDFAFRTLGLAPCWAAIESLLPAASKVHKLDLCKSLGHVTHIDPLSLSTWVVSQYEARDNDSRERVTSSLAWIFNELRDWDAFVADAAAHAASPRLAMALLVRNRAREAAVYHHEYRLAGRTLSTWFKDAQYDPELFIDTLAKSRLVVAGDADRSPLVTTLVAPGGRMFRVFGENDLATIRCWINSINIANDKSKITRFIVKNNTQAVSFDMVRVVDDAAPGYAPDQLRQLYYALQGRALAPTTRRIAERYARDWLDRSARSMQKSNRGIPANWNPGALRTWLHDQHDRHASEFERSDPLALPSRAEVIDSTLQLAPLTLIDGAWLQGFSDYRLAASQVGFALFQTYWDELGNGLYELNHPKIYRDALLEMGIELFPTGSHAFAHDTRFRDDSFRLPTYWLCLGKFPRTFMPEILGMNLAMELSGVGGTYRTARRFLHHHGFSTQFVDLHNVIDNVATGHSAWAVDAIDAYMRQVAARGSIAIAANWERVRIGYESLSPLPERRQQWFEKLRLRRRTSVASPSCNETSDPGPLHHPLVAKPV